MPIISKEEFIESYRAGTRNFRRIELEKGADLEGATLCQVNLTYASLYRVNLRQADLQGSQLSRAVFAEADLSKANLCQADLSRANLQGANLQGANLQEANLQGANLQGANLQGAIYNQQTQFSADFEPSQAGLFAFQTPPPTTPTSSLPPTRFLRLLRKEASTSDRLYPLSATREVFIGRDLHCQIVLDSKQYSNVSRHHAVIRPFLSAPGVITWEIEDLGSANGTYVNGQRIRENCSLQIGDHISLGYQGPEFIFESQDELNQSQLSFPDFIQQTNPKPPNSLSLSQLFPIISTVWDLPKKAYLIPMTVTVIVVILMFAKVGDPDPTDFNRILGIYLGGVTYYFIYQLCGKQKPWWVILVTALATMLMLNSPLWSLFDLVFRRILPGEMPKSPETAGFFALLLAHFFGAGLMEELFKALPVLGAYFLGQILSEPWRKQIGVWEPLDGILLGTASALGFTIVETLGQYVPKVVQIWGSRAGWELLIPRILGSVACHIAYSGYFGYCIGLSILQPARRWQIVAVGYLTVAFLHALWNASGSLNLWLLAIVGVVSYAFLAAAILKARTLSSFDFKKESS